MTRAQRKRNQDAYYNFMANALIVLAVAIPVGIMIANFIFNATHIINTAG